MEKSNNRISKKDIVVIVLSVLALAILVFIILFAQKNDRIETQELAEHSTNTNQESDIKAEKEEGVIQSGLLLTEANGDKWIELYNNSNTDYDISGFSLYLSGNKIAEIEEGTKVLKNDFYVIELAVNPGEKNSNLLALKDKNDNQIVTLIIPKLASNQSFGRKTKDSNDMGYVPASKGIDNERPDEYQMIYYGGIGVSCPSGFYNTEFDLSLSVNEDETIYYTLDGTKPSVESTKYESPIRISNMSGSKYVYAALGFGYEIGTDYYPPSVDMGVVLRAIKVNSNGEITGETTQNYYVGLLKDSAYLKLPVLTINAEPDDMFGYFDGIYVGGRSYEDGIAKGQPGMANFLNNWYKDAMIQYYEPDKGKSFEAPVLIGINRDTAMNSKQKGFSFSFPSEDFSDFEGSSILDYISGSNVLVANSNLNDNDYKVRELLINSLIADSKVGNRDDSPCVVFVNGEYWGLYSLRKYTDPKYIKEKYNITEDIYFYNGNDYLEAFDQLYRFVIQNDMSLNENYEELKKMMDVDSYLEFMCINMYVGNFLFDTKSSNAWRTVEAGNGNLKDGKWRWIIGSTDLTMGLTNETSYSIDTYLFQNISNDAFFNSLLMNKDFCANLVKTMDRVAVDYFNEEAYNEKLTIYSALLKKPVVESRMRYWGGYDDNSFTYGINKILKYLSLRYEYISVYTKEIAEKGGDINVIQAEREILNQAVAQE